MGNRKINGRHQNGGDRLITVFTTAVAIIIAILLGSVFISISGENPIEIYLQFLKGAFGSQVLSGITVSRMATLLLIGLGVSIAFQCNLVNIGGDGQLCMGALGSVLVALYIKGIPSILHILLCFAVGFLFGGLWGMLTGVLKAYKGMSEMITTIMLNYIATWFISFLVNGVLKDTQSNYPYPWTPEVPEAIKLEGIFGTKINSGILIALFFAGFVYWFLKNTTTGYELRASGKSREASAFVGINVKKSIIKSMFFSGGFAGMAGCVELLGSQFRLTDTFSNGYGFEGVAVAFLANSNPIGTIFSSFFFSGLQCGAENVARITNISSSVSGIIQGIIILLILIGSAGNIKKYIRNLQERRA